MKKTMKFKRVLCLDIDDCIFPGNSFFFGETKPNDNFNVLELNMKRIGMMCEDYDIGIFITSAWYNRFIIDDGNLVLKRDLDGIIVVDEVKVRKLMNQYAPGRFCGLSCGRRQEDIAKLLNDGHIVIGMDDMNLDKKEIIDYGIKYGWVEPRDVSENYHFAEVNGFITNPIAYKMMKFLEGIKD